jgi:hypothetical protein
MDFSEIMNWEGRGNKKGRVVIVSGVLSLYSGRDSVVSMATWYGLDVSGIETPLGRDFPYRCRLSAMSLRLLYRGYRVFRRGKAAGAWC